MPSSRTASTSTTRGPLRRRLPLLARPDRGDRTLRWHREPESPSRVATGREGYVVLVFGACSGRTRTESRLLAARYKVDLDDIHGYRCRQADPLSK